MNIKIYFAVFLFGSMIGVNVAPLNTELVINGTAETGDTTGWTSTGIDAVAPDSFATGFGSFVFTVVLVLEMLITRHFHRLLMLVAIQMELMPINSTLYSIAESE